MPCETLNNETAVELPDGSNQAARARLLAVKGEPLFLANWLRPVFIHFEIPASTLQCAVPFELDLYEGKAYVSLVAFTMRGMRPFRGGRLAAWLFKPIATNDYLNVRTYVRHRGERGIYFLTEWMNNRLSVHLGPLTFGLPYRFGTLNYEHWHEKGILRGNVSPNSPMVIAKNPSRIHARNFVPPSPEHHLSLTSWRRGGRNIAREMDSVAAAENERMFLPAFFSEIIFRNRHSLNFQYEAKLDNTHFVPCSAGSVDEFLLERYTAFTAHKTKRRFFRIWHQPWQQQTVQISILDRRLIETVWPWFENAAPALGHYSPGAFDVWMGRPHNAS